MTKCSISNKPDMTPEEASELFKSKFAGKYEVYMTKLVGRDFIIKKSGWTGIAVKLAHEGRESTFVYNKLCPSALARLSMVVPIIALGLIVAYFSGWRKSWNEMEDEIKDFMETSPEFQ